MKLQEDTSEQNTSQKPYEPPRLDVLGTVASLTLGGGGSYGDSGSLAEESGGGSGNIHH